MKGKGCIFIKMIKMELPSERKEGRGGGEGREAGKGIKEPALLIGC